MVSSLLPNCRFSPFCSAWCRLALPSPASKRREHDERPVRPARADDASYPGLLDQLWRIPNGPAGCPQLCRGHPRLDDRSGLRQYFRYGAVDPWAEHDPDDEFCRLEGLGVSRCCGERVCHLRTSLYDLLCLLPAMGPVPRRAMATD